MARSNAIPRGKNLCFRRCLGAVWTGEAIIGQQIMLLQGAIIQESLQWGGVQSATNQRGLEGHSRGCDLADFLQKSCEIPSLLEFAFIL